MPDAILNDLWNNWMFRLSLSSNELFHSNFLQAIIADPGATDVDDRSGQSSWSRVRELAKWASIDAWVSEIEEEYGAHPVYVYREWHQLDLAVVVRIRNGDDKVRELVLFALELKIKSYPTMEQVERYLQEMKKHNTKKTKFTPRLVLLSLVEPTAKFHTVHDLSLMDFGQLAAGVRTLPQSGLKFGPAMDEYIRFCESLHQMGQHWKSVLNEATTLADVVGMEQTYRKLNSIWSKLCASQLCELVAKEMEGTTISEDIVFSATPGFSNSRWSADLLWSLREDPKLPRKKKDPSKAVARVGVQVEGETIRFMLNAENVGSRHQDARKVVEDALLAQANEQGLFEPLNQLYEFSKTGTDTLAQERLQKFWHDKPMALDAGGLPSLSKPSGKSGFGLTGFKNSSTFGHADYRLTLDRSVTLGDLSKTIAAVLKGEYNRDRLKSFVDILTRPDAFDSAPV